MLKQIYDLFFVLEPEVIQQSVDLFVELLDLSLPIEVEQIHLGEMGLLEFPQLLRVLHPVLVHLLIFKSFFEFFGLAFEPLSLNVLALGFALFLPCDGFFSECCKKYMRSHNWAVSIGDSWVFNLGDLLSILGEGSIFLAVVGRL